jgi:hypothetical protein
MMTFLGIWNNNLNQYLLLLVWVFVATFALGSWPKQGLARLRAKRGSPVVKESVREWTLTLPKELSPWVLESQWTPECSKSDCKGENPMDWGVLYTIGNILKLRCLKWARMIHLDIWNTSYGQKKGRESNWQFDSRPLKVGVDPISLCAGPVQLIIGNILTRATTLLWTSS